MIDTHCHLDKEDYEDLDIIISNMKENLMIASGYDYKTSKNAIELANKYKNIYCTIGIHPSEVKTTSIKTLELIKELAKNNKVVGIGEIGLDFHWDQDNKEQQKKYFINQINIAKECNLPIVIHSRDANNDTLEVLKNNLGDTKAILHCYSGSYELAKEFIKLGVKFGIGGVLTFKNSKKLIEVVEKLGLENFVLETDSPYLTPEPFRGKKNEPYNIYYVAQKIAEIKNIDFDTVIEITTKNALETFNIKN